jgi:hypothetical protein
LPREPGYINPRVASTAAQNAATSAAPDVLDDLLDVDTTTTPPTDGQGLIFDATSGLWIPGTAAAGATDLDGLSDVDTTTVAPTDGQLLKYDAASGLWIPADPPAPGATSLDGLSDVDTTTTAPTDGQLLKYDAASGLWKPATVSSGASWYAGHVPTAASLTLVSGDATNATLTDDSDVGLLLDGGTPVAGDKARGAEKAIANPAADWTFTVHAKFLTPTTNFGGAGIYCRDSVGGKMLFLNYQQSQALVLDRKTLSNYTSTPFTFTYSAQKPEWLRIKYVAATSTLEFWVSLDGKLWAKEGSELVSAFIATAPNRVGLAVDYNRTTGPNAGISCDYMLLA